MGSRFGEEGRRLSYGAYLKVPELLSLQQGLSEAHDELLFIVAHQVYELWFKVVLDELEASRSARHVLMVERQIGSKTGTGGSSGAQYLRSTLGKRFFPDLWEVGSQL
jgi:tryptophan 2,3-dioxygenase